jgi:hypothetical protein
MKKGSEHDPTEENIDELLSAEWHCGFGQCAASKEAMFTSQSYIQISVLHLAVLDIRTWSGRGDYS